MKLNLILTLVLTFLIFSSFVNANQFPNFQVKHVESIKDSIFKDILAQMNLTKEKIVKDEKLNLYYIYLNETSANDNDKCDFQINTLKFVNKTHACYVLGDKNSKLFDELSILMNIDWNSTEKINLDELYKFENISKIDFLNDDSEIELKKGQPVFRSLANFHKLNYNEVNYRRNNLKRRYIDDDVDESKLSKKEKKKRKKRRKKLKKREKELRDKRKKYKSPLDKLRSTIKWMACIEVSLALCSCCFTLVQAVVLPFISPIPFGSRIQPISGQPIRGFEDYGIYSGFQQNSGIYCGLPMNGGNFNPNFAAHGNNCNCNSNLKSNLGDALSLNGNLLGNGIFGRMHQFQRNA